MSSGRARSPGATRRGGYRGRFGRGNGRGWGQFPWSRGRQTGGRGGGVVVPSGPKVGYSANMSAKGDFCALHAVPIASSPYPLWRTYFHDEDYSQDSQTAKRVKAFEKFFLGYVAQYNLCMSVMMTVDFSVEGNLTFIGNLTSCWTKDEIESRGSLQLDCAMLLSDTILKDAFPDLADAVRNQPDNVLAAAALALHTVILASMHQLTEALVDGDIASDEAEEVTLDVHRLYVRICNYEPVIPLKNLKATQYGKCVSVQGTVVRVGNVKPLVTRLAFKCIACQGIQVLALQDGKYAIPNKCAAPDCKGFNFLPLRSSQLTETIQWQTIRIQESAGDERREAGRIPRTIECELTADLVDSCVPGDMVTVAAVVKATGSDEGRGRNSKDKCMFLLYLHAISVVNSKHTLTDGCSGLQIEFSTTDYYAIQEIQGDPNVFKLIVGSLCPAIYGHEMVKAGLILGLFGGTQRCSDKISNLSVRGDPHILLVGDPGLGKSQMLQAAANIAPRGVYVCGNMATSSGLTVTLSREGGGSGEHALEAGALVLADQGCCCIDEFDKMGTQHLALLEAMEQQVISVAKAGIVCSLPARTAILAAANPSGGHYNKGKTVSENLKMNSALLSRFDLVFILLDKPDEEKDLLLSEHVMSLHAGNRSSVLRVTATRPRIEETHSILFADEESPLTEKLKIGQGEVFDPVPSILLRKYIGYARKYVHPKLTPDAADVLKKFYLELRRHRHSPDSTPITTRQLESLIRLTEARARVELRESASAQDAKDVVEIMKFSMYDTFSDELGLLDFERSEHGSGMSQRSQAKRLVAELGRVSRHQGSPMFTVQQMKDIAKRIGIQILNFEDLISSLNNQNYILKKGPKTYQLQTV